MPACEVAVGSYLTVGAANAREHIMNKWLAWIGLQMALLALALPVQAGPVLSVGESAPVRIARYVCRPDPDLLGDGPEGVPV